MTCIHLTEVADFLRVLAVNEAFERVLSISCEGEFDSREIGPRQVEGADAWHGSVEVARQPAYWARFSGST